MKRVFSVFIATIVCVVLFLPVGTAAATASASLTGPAQVRAGDTITLSFNLTGSGLYGVSGTLAYDGSQVALTGTTQKISSPWMVEFNGNNFVAYDNNLSNPVKGNTTLFTATFKVKDVAAGTAIKITFTGVTASDGTEDVNVGTVTYSVTVAEPLSTDNDLANLTVSNATISPAFSAAVTSYEATVPFEVAKLDVAAQVKDKKAKVSINNPTLVPNATTKVVVTVTAENGAKKTYTISVKRAQDPNYKASDNNKLSGITVEGFLLSPVFHADTTQYVVWLPYETDTVKVDGIAADEKASVQVVGGDKLAAGQDNPIKVICTAENGDKKEYTVIAKRAAAHDGSVEELPEEPQEDVPADTVPEQPTEQAENGIAWWWLPIVGAAALLLGIAGGILFKSFVSKK